MKLHRCKETNKLLKNLLKEGWTLEKGKHLKVRHPSGQHVVLSISPSCPFAFKHFQGDVKRLKKRFAN